MLPELLRRVIALRARWRGWELPFFAAPLAPAALVFSLAGNGSGVTGCLLGLLFTWLAMRKVQRGRAGDTRRAAIMMGVGTGLAALLAARMAMPMPLVLGAMAFFGTRLLYAQLPELAPPPPPEPAPPPTPPSPVEDARARLERVRSAARWLQDAHLAATAEAMAGVLDDLGQRPDRLPLARRFLAVHLDGLERITERLMAGASPPAALATLLDDLTRTAAELREKLRREESEALEIQVKVLSDRLKQEGFA
jgi:hypothetical protein